MKDISEIITSSMEAAGAPITDGVVESEVSSGDAPPPDAAADDAPPPDAAADTPPADADAAPLAADAEVKPPVEEPEVPDLTDAELAGVTLPLHRHKAVLTKARKATAAAEAKLKEYEWANVPEAKEKLAAISVAETNPELFAQVLLADAKLGPVFKKMLGATEPAPPAAVPAAAKAATVVEKPQPDVLLPDGTLGYSQAVQDQLLAWHAQQLEAGFDAKLAEKFGKVDPILKTHEAQVEYNKELQRQIALVQVAKKEWPQFEKFEKDIQAYLLKPGNEKVTLEEGYRKVVIPKLQADRDTMRKELLAEQAGKAKAATQVTPPSGQSTKPAGAKRTTEDIIRENMQKLGA